MSKKFVIGIDLGGTNLKIALLSRNYKIIKKRFLITRAFTRKEALIEAIVSAVNGIMKEDALRGNDVLGVGLGVPGPTDCYNGIVHFFPNIPGWREVNLKKILGKKLNLAVSVDNDAKVMALAEYKSGAAAGFKNAVCLTLGTGVGGAVFIEGRLYRGKQNASGEIGHLPINESGPACNCGGSACLEAYIGNKRILEQARKVFKRKVSLEELSALAAKRNKQALEIWRNVGMRLGVALSGLVNFLNLDAIVIGGGVANAGAVLFGQVRKTVRERAMSVQGRHVKIFKAKLGADAGLIGAGILVGEGVVA